MGIKITNNFNAAKAIAKRRAALGLYAHTSAKKMEAEAKSNGPWTDRTAAARNSIQGDFGWRGNLVVITLSGNMDYSVYLELAMERKYEILRPTVNRNAPEILRGYQKLVK